MTDLVYKLTQEGKKILKTEVKNEDSKCDIAATIKSFLIEDFIATKMAKKTVAYTSCQVRLLS